MLDYNEREDLCNRIINGYAIVHYKGIIYHIKDPNISSEYQGKKFEDDLIQNLRYENIPTSDQLLSILMERKLWDVNNDEKIVEMQNAIKELKKLLPTLEFKSITRKQTLEQIERLKQEILRIIRSKESLLTNSIENIARFEKYRWFIFNLTYDENGKRVWKDWKKFGSIPEKTINHLISKAYFDERMTDSNIRLLARTDPWRSLWIYMGKTGQGIPIKEMTNLKKSLISWSLVYDNVYESMDCPPNEIIENDELLDIWFDVQREKREKEKSEKQGESIKDITSRHPNAQEIGIVVESPEDAKKVFDMNSALSKMQIRNRFEVVKDKGTAQELNMPDVKQNLQLLVNQTAISKTMKRK